jgi:hypothetical protein
MGAPRDHPIESVIANGLVALKMRGQSIPMGSALIAALRMCVGLGIFGCSGVKITIA